MHCCSGDVSYLYSPIQEGDAYGAPHLGTGKILGKEVTAGKPIVRKWLRLYHRRTKQPANFGKARICVSVEFNPVGAVRPLYISRVCASPDVHKLALWSERG